MVRNGRFGAVLGGILLLGGTAARAQEEAGSVSPERPAADVPAVETRIAAATVYLDHAWVTREGTATLEAGVRLVAVRGLPAELDDGSIRVEIEGDARLEETAIHRAFLVRHDEAALRALEARARELQDRITAEEDRIRVLAAEEAFLQSLRAAQGGNLSREVGAGTVVAQDAAAYREVLSYVTEAMLTGVQKRREAERAVRDLRPELEACQRGIAEAARGVRLEQKDVVLSLSVPRPGPVRLRLAYQVPGALWFPVYDIRSEGDGKNLEIAYHAVVQQATGEDWSGVALTLCAARPAVRTGLPGVAPWFVTVGDAGGGFPTSISSLGQRQEEYAPWANLRAQSAMRLAQNGEAHARLLENCFQIEKFQAVFSLRNGEGRRTSSASFPAARPETVPGDGRARRVAVASLRLPMERRLSAIPSVAPDVYVAAAFRNGFAHPLLPGTATVFSGSDRVGTAEIGFTAPNEPIETFLGVDESVKVTRELDRQRSSETALSGRKRLEVAYTLVVENFGGAATTVAIREPTPVSQDERVRVRMARPSVPPSSEERGVLTWEIPVAPGGRSEITYGFTLEFPQEMSVTTVAGG
ncbi:MAG: mucoidy inhibitor MuiA family protein [Planctomycetes bacterium]|nr:mucoidy inhibitor MuiA family protein [Planctomycetota bacterium]